MNKYKTLEEYTLNEEWDLDNPKQRKLLTSITYDVSDLTEITQELMAWYEEELEDETPGPKEIADEFKKLENTIKSLVKTAKELKLKV